MPVDYIKMYLNLWQHLAENLLFSWNAMGKFISLFHELSNFKNNVCEWSSNIIPSMSFHQLLLTSRHHLGSLKVRFTLSILEARDPKFLISLRWSVLAGLASWMNPERNVFFALPARIPSFVITSPHYLPLSLPWLLISFVHVCIFISLSVCMYITVCICKCVHVVSTCLPLVRTPVMEFMDDLIISPSQNPKHNHTFKNPLAF